MTSSRAALWPISSLLALGACSTPTGPGPKTAAVVHETQPPPKAAERKREPLPRDIVARSAKPFYGLSDGRRLEPAELKSLLTRAPVLCVGERHDDPVHHYVQLQVIDLVTEHAKVSSSPVAVGYEMFRRPAQAAMTAFQHGTLDEAGLLSQSDYERNWGFDYSLYRPLLERARDGGASMLALNAPRDWTRSVAKRGLQGIDSELRQKLPELDLSNEEHRLFFKTAMSGHPGHGSGSENKQAGKKPSSKDKARHKDKAGRKKKPHSMPPKMLENFYVAQVIWDETMAESVSEFLTESAPSSPQVVIIAGNGHCHHSAIPSRVERRTGSKVLSVRPIRKEQLGKASAPRDDQFDLLLVIDEVVGDDTPNN